MKNTDDAPVEESPSNSDKKNKVVDDPIFFAEWVNKYIMLNQSFEDDLNLVRCEEECQSIKMSSKERRLCANEYVLLRALGICLFVRNGLGEKYYLTFREALMPLVIKRMDCDSLQMHYDKPSAALDQYLDCLNSDSPYSFSETYLNRVYPDNKNHKFLLLRGIPILCGLQHAMSSFDLTQDEYCKLKFCDGYETRRQPHNLVDETK